MPPRKKTPAKSTATKSTAKSKSDRTVDQAPPVTDSPETVEITLSAHHEDHLPGDKIEVPVDEAAALKHAGVAGPPDEAA